MSTPNEPTTTTTPSSTTTSSETSSDQSAEQQPQSMEHHRQTLERKIAENNLQDNHDYISPSDAIMSPASQKLAGFKQKQINKGGSSTARSLFAKQMSGKENAPQTERKSVEEGLGG